MFHWGSGNFKTMSLIYPEVLCLFNSWGQYSLRLLTLAGNNDELNWSVSTRGRLPLNDSNTAKLPQNLTSELKIF